VAGLDGVPLDDELVLVGEEPTRREGLTDLVRTVRKERPDAILRLVTDAARCADRAYATSLSEAGVDRFTVRLFGPRPRVHDAETGIPGSFNASLAGIRTLIDLNLWVEVEAVATRRALTHITETARLIATSLYGVAQVIVRNPMWGDNGLVRGTSHKVHPHDAYPLVDMAADIIAHHDIPVRLKGFPFIVTDGKAPYPLTDSALTGWPIGLALEVIAMDEGLKPAARVSLDPGRSKELADFCLRRGLALEQATFRHRFGPNEAGLRERSSDSRAGLVFFYLAPEKAAAKAVRDADAAGDDDALGEALGYPVCCRRFYTRNVTAGRHPDLAMAAYNEGPADTYPFELNTLSTYITGLVFHQPHTYTCAPSLRMARDLMAALRRREPLLATAVEHALRCHVVYASPACRLSLWGRRRGGCVEVENLVPFGDAIRPDLAKVDAVERTDDTVVLRAGDQEIARITAPGDGQPLLVTFE
jgi:hypothetical protein